MNGTKGHIQEFEGFDMNMTDVNQKVIEYVLDASSVTLLVVIMISFGCTLTFSELKKYFLKPKEIGIAVIAQYGIMPLSAFSLGYFLNLSAIESLVILICGCCPGGNISNIFTLAIKGDMYLSILMTIYSNILALVMMPFLLFIYSLGMDLGPLYKNVPYGKIVISLIITIIPCFVGILLNSKRPQYALCLIKIGKILAVVMTIVILILSGLYVKSNVLKLFSPWLIAAAVLMPLVGFVFGYGMSAFFRLCEQSRRTICMETGCQNVQLCTVILKVSFAADVMGPYFMFPLLYIMFQVLEGLFIILVLRLHDRKKAKVADLTYCSVNDTEKGAQNLVKLNN